MLARFPTVLVCFTLHVGCTAGTSGGPHGIGGASDTGDDSDTSSGGSGGSASGGSNPGGGGGGDDGSGGDRPGGATSSEYLEPGECQSVLDCPKPPDPGWGAVRSVRCAAPYTMPQTVYPGVAPPRETCTPNGCAIPAPLPDGLGFDCQTDDDCPELGALSGTAGLCRDGVCVVCEQDSDCEASSPFCGRGSWDAFSEDPLMMACVECRTNTDCAAPAPFCVNIDRSGDRCVECRSTADCADGLCENHVCVAECTADAGCPDPALPCSAHARCEAAACTTDAECPPNLGCRDGTCLRKPCDEGCDGVCYGGACHEEYGHCVVITSYP